MKSIVDADAPRGPLKARFGVNIEYMTPKRILFVPQLTDPLIDICLVKSGDKIPDKPFFLQADTRYHLSQVVKAFGERSLAIRPDHQTGDLYEMEHPSDWPNLKAAFLQGPLSFSDADRQRACRALHAHNQRHQTTFAIEPNVPKLLKRHFFQCLSALIPGKP